MAYALTSKSKFDDMVAFASTVVYDEPFTFREAMERQESGRSAIIMGKDMDLFIKVKLETL